MFSRSTVSSALAIGLAALVSADTGTVASGGQCGVYTTYVDSTITTWSTAVAMGKCVAGLCCGVPTPISSGSLTYGAVCSDPGTGSCTGPGCQLLYADKCDGNQPPQTGSSTLNLPRPQFGSIAYGSIITSCIVPKTIALTFDDGPLSWTQELLNYLDSNGIKATFFINAFSGGKGDIGLTTNQYHQVVKNAFNAGHQIASHTWTHEDLTASSDDIIHNQILYNEQSLGSILDGIIPTYLRPPYLSCGGSCATIANQYGYHLVGQQFMAELATTALLCSAAKCIG
jgi:hypothetical protein